MRHTSYPGNDALVIGLVRQHKDAISKAGGEVWYSLTMGEGPACILCDLPAGTDPNTVAPLPEPHTWTAAE